MTTSNPGSAARSTWAAVASVTLAAAAIAAARPVTLPAIDGTVVVDRRGVPLAERPTPDGARSRRLVCRGGGCAPELVAMTIAAEDHRFDLHPGVDPIAVARAAATNLRAGAVREGGSTLAQQLARTLEARGPGLLGKAWEALRALRLTAALGRDGVLEEYLARTWYGNGAVGAEIASKVYYDRPASALSLAQAATLAAIPRAPSDLDPFRDPAAVRRARDRVLDRAVRAGRVESTRAALAKAEPLGLLPARWPGHAPHFVRRVATRPGRVVSTLDLALQSRVESIVREELAPLRRLAVDHAAVIVADLHTRDVLAYVGSASWTARDGQVDGAASRRSPGSALKPFLFALALEEGATLADVVADTPGSWRTPHGTWHPENYGQGSGGPVRLREALGNSLNLPAVRLAERVGVADLHTRLVRLGLTTLDERPDHYGLALTLGSAEVRLDELVAAYAALGTSGRWRPLRYTRDAPKPAPKQVIAPAAAWAIVDVLDDPDARAAAFGRASALEPAFPLAAKTGTSQGWRDNWAIGVTPHVAVGVWVGRFDGGPMGEVSGITGAAPILRRVAEAAMEGRPRASFTPPPTLARAAICPLSGASPGHHCPAARDEWLPRTAAARPACTWHDAGGIVLPAEWGAWAHANGHRTRTDTDGAVRVAYPATDTVFWLDPDRAASEQAVPLRADAPAGATVIWEVDGEPVATTTMPGAARWVPTPGDHRVVARVGAVTSTPVRVWVGGGLDKTSR